MVKRKKREIFNLFVIVVVALLVVLVISLVYEGNKSISFLLGSPTPPMLQTLKIDYFTSSEHCPECETQDKIIDRIGEKFWGYVSIVKHDAAKEDVDVPQIPLLVISGKSGRIGVVGPKDEETLVRIICEEYPGDLGEICG